MSLVAIALKKGVLGAVSTLHQLLWTTGVFGWDFVLTLVNAIMPNRKFSIQAAQQNGLWMKPTPEDSRCSCPALNALANHGLLPRDGKNIKFTELSQVIHKTYNFAPSFCYFVPSYAAQFLGRNYYKDTLNLSDLDVHNCIEHDASLLRWDAAKSPDQSIIAQELVDGLLDNATGDGGKTLTVDDLSRYTAIRRAHSKATNSQFTLSGTAKFFGSSNSSTLLIFFGGNIKDLTTFLKEERLPDGWQTKARSYTGMTMAKFNIVAAQIELGIDKYQKLAARQF